MKTGASRSTPGRSARSTRLARPSAVAFVAPLLLGSVAARAADPQNTIEAVVTASGADDCGGAVTLSWSGQLRRDLDRRESFATLTVPKPVLSMTPATCEGKCARREYDTAGASLYAHFERLADGQTRFGLVVDGIRVRWQLAEGEGCRSIEDSHSLTVDTFDESPFRLTREELEAGFERSFSIQGDGFPGYTGSVQVRLRKGVGQPDVIVEGPHCACGADATAEVTARSTSGDVVFERFEVKGAPPGTVRRNEGGRVARLVVGNAAKAGGPVEAVAVYRHRGNIRRAPPHAVHLALVEQPKIADNEKWGGKGGADFAFDGGDRGHVEFQAEGRAWLDGKDASKSLRWLADAAYLRPEPLVGARAKFQADGLPRSNAEFGRKEIRATLEEQGCACQSEPAEVRIFYWRDARNSPERRRPNWAYYWAQTRAGQGIAFELGRAPCGRDLGQSGGMYDYCSDAVYLPEDKPRKTCRHPRGRSKGNEGIDCFAQTLRHERHHQVELKEWWMGRPITPVSLDDPDGDLMPIWVEGRYGCKEGAPGPAGLALNPTQIWDQLEEAIRKRQFRNTQFSCPVGRGAGKRPFDDVIDSEINAYWVGWSWPTGSADDEDWARPGKNWPAD